MSAPRLTLACELDPARLVELFADGSVITDIQALHARVALMLSDFSADRAAVVKQLNAAGVLSSASRAMIRTGGSPSGRVT